MTAKLDAHFLRPAFEGETLLAWARPKKICDDCRSSRRVRDYRGLPGLTPGIYARLCVRCKDAWVARRSPPEARG